MKTFETLLEMAMYYYPRLWNINRINALYEAGKLTKEQYAEIVGEETEKRQTEMLPEENMIEEEIE